MERQVGIRTACQNRCLSGVKGHQRKANHLLISTMGKEPKVSKEEREAQSERLYAKVGKIAVLGEHLNFAMNSCC